MSVIYLIKLKRTHYESHPTLPSVASHAGRRRDALKKTAFVLR